MWIKTVDLKGLNKFFSNKIKNYAQLIHSLCISLNKYIMKKLIHFYYIISKKKTLSIKLSTSFINNCIITCGYKYFKNLDINYSYNYNQ